LRNNLSAAAHLIHGSSEGRFEVLYAPGTLTEDEVKSVGYSYGNAAQLTEQYQCQDLDNGWHQDANGEEFYFIRDPGLGLWMRADHPYAVR